MGRAPFQWTPAHTGWDRELTVQTGWLPWSRILKHSSRELKVNQVPPTFHLLGT
jgi:hypothetical protein